MQNFISGALMLWCVLEDSVTEKLHQWSTAVVCVRG